MPLQIQFMSDIGVESSWCYSRLPEYLWIGLILEYYGRDEGLKKMHQILQCLKIVDDNKVAIRFSEILKLSDKKQNLLSSNY